MFKFITSCLIFVTASAMASPLNDNGSIKHVQFEDNSVLVYQCSEKASGHVNIAFLDKEGMVHPFVVVCGVES